ncbi:efflux RND transporter periplasmic adaptor subunit [Hwanghaeella sp. LZ110]|uniref:efflux RND transporter periplasmic adaptor subunit n=1 Tax=Hwanghaeella sp. LZ110 TaxID=3402810 RepID=UPI003B66E9DC
MSPAKQIMILIAIGAIALGGYEGWQHYDQKLAKSDAAPNRSAARVIPVETAPVIMRPMETTIEAVGSTRAKRTVEIKPFADGRVVEVAFKAGQSVEAGETLLRLDDEIERADLIEAQARLKDALSALKRAETLRKSNTVAEATVDTLVANVAIAQAERDRATRRLQDRTVKAPFAGVVGYSNVELGAQVETGDTITILDDLSVVEVEFFLSEDMFGRITPGQKVEANAAAFPGRKFDAEILSLDSRIAPISRSFQVRAFIPNPDRTLPAGMFMHLSIVLDADETLTVPEEAVVVDGNQSYVFAITQRDDGLRASRRNVSIGRRSIGYVEILGGLAQGEDVVIRGVQKVRENSLVAPKSARQETVTSEATGT